MRGWPGRLTDSCERPRLAAVAAGVQPDNQSIPDRDNVISPVVGPPLPVLIDPWRSHHQYYLITGGDDLLKLGPQPQGRLPTQPFL